MSKKKPKPEKEVPPPPRLWFGWIIGAVIALIIAAVAGGSYMLVRESVQESEPAETEKPLTPSLTPLREFRVVNAHEHLFSRKYLDKYLSAADETGVVKTLFVASSEFTLMGKGHDQAKGNDENTEEILAAAHEFPDKIIPFCTIHPGDPQKLEKIKKYVGEGVKGLKLYTGHGSFYDRPLDSPDMMSVYAYCEETRLPICWHVNYVKYAAEFERVMAKFPRLKVIVPHFGVTFFRPGDASFRDFERLLDKYPTIYTDTSFGTRNILVDGLEVVSRNTEVFRAFMLKYGDRVLFGTDMVVTGNKEKSTEWIADVIRACRDVLEKDVYTYAMGAKGSPYASKNSTNTDGVFRGLALDDATLRKIYETNFETFLSMP